MIATMTTVNGAKTVRRKLLAAKSSNDLVRVCRRGSGWDRREGYVAGVGRKWLLVATPDDRVRPDGVSAVRLRDVTSVTRSKSNDRFLKRALEIHQAWPPTWAPELDLDSTRGLLESLGSAYPLISLFIENDDPDVCFIGKAERVTSSAVHLREVTPQARWRGGSKWTFGQISRLDAGGGYEVALAEVAGNPPRG